jgi:hypothetical protein
VCDSSHKSSNHCYRSDLNSLPFKAAALTKYPGFRHASLLLHAILAMSHGAEIVMYFDQAYLLYERSVAWLPSSIGALTFHHLPIQYDSVH